MKKNKMAERVALKNSNMILEDFRRSITLDGLYALRGSNDEKARR